MLSLPQLTPLETVATIVLVALVLGVGLIALILRSDREGARSFEADVAQAMAVPNDDADLLAARSELESMQRHPSGDFDCCVVTPLPPVDEVGVRRLAKADLAKGYTR